MDISSSAQAEFSHEMSNILGAIERDSVRPMEVRPCAVTNPQVKAYRCMAKCAEDSSTTTEQKHDCMQRCATQVEAAQTVMQNEVKRFEARVMRALQSCEDTARDQVRDGASPAAQKAFDAAFQSCAVKTLKEQGDLFRTTIAPAVRKQIAQVAARE